MKPTLEIITVGNEILIGHTLDTNSHWLAERATAKGWKVQRVTQVQDTSGEISSTVRESLGRSPSILITIGGLGPTHDDMTLKGIARALGRPLALDSTALNMITRHYGKFEGFTSLIRERRKMAILPRGANPLPNPIGTAPGVMIQSGETRIFSLPGVPSEMKAIFKQSIAPILRNSQTNPPLEAYLSLVGIVESALAPVLRRAQLKFPRLYFKSHPRGNETGIRSLIQLHIYATRHVPKDEITKASAHIVASLSRASRNLGSRWKPSKK